MTEKRDRKALDDIMFDVLDLTQEERKVNLRTGQRPTGQEYVGLIEGKR